ncbi:hypothetical protein BC829DRAFT_441168 [Chytridium lagenaria]|nr:hypothetical protein BC829DRAFT_441168 [Chytridium lagenaria]
MAFMLATQPPNPTPNPTTTRPSTSFPPQLEDIFKCYICFESLSKPVMCPSCSKIGCEGCVIKWLSQDKNQCPHCRAPLVKSQLVNCRFVEELAQQLRGAIVTNSSSGDSQTVCPNHPKVPLYYYCHDCNDAICSDCAVIDNKHRDHKFEHLHAVYQTHRTAIETKSRTLRDRLGVFEDALKEVADMMVEIRKRKRAEESMIFSFVNVAKEGIEGQARDKILALMDKRNEIQAESEMMKMTLEALDHHIQKAPHLDIIKNSEKLIDLLAKHPATTKPSQPLATITNSICFESTRFSQRKEMGGNGLLGCGAHVWRGNGRLKIYCGGNGHAKGTFMSAFLEMVNGNQEATAYQYRMEVVPVVRSSDSLGYRENTSMFVKGECWGYNRFMSLGNMEQFLEEDTVTVRYGVRALTYRQRCIDLERYIQKSLTVGQSLIPEVDVVKRNVTTDLGALNDTAVTRLVTPVVGVTRPASSRNRDVDEERDVERVGERVVVGDTQNAGVGDGRTGWRTLGEENQGLERDGGEVVMEVMRTRESIVEERAAEEQTSGDRNVNMSLEQLRNDMRNFESFVETMSREVRLLETITHVNTNPTTPTTTTPPFTPRLVPRPLFRASRPVASSRITSSMDAFEAEEESEDDMLMPRRNVVLPTYRERRGREVQLPPIPAGLVTRREVGTGLGLRRWRGDTGRDFEGGRRRGESGQSSDVGVDGGRGGGSVRSFERDRSVERRETWMARLDETVRRDARGLTESGVASSSRMDDVAQWVVDTMGGSDDESPFDRPGWEYKTTDELDQDLDEFLERMEARRTRGGGLDALLERVGRMDGDESLGRKRSSAEEVVRVARGILGEGSSSTRDVVVMGVPEMDGPSTTTPTTRRVLPPVETIRMLRSRVLGNASTFVTRPRPPAMESWEMFRERVMGESSSPASTRSRDGAVSAPLVRQSVEGVVRPLTSSGVSIADEDVGGMSISRLERMGGLTGNDREWEEWERRWLRDLEEKQTMMADG